MQKYTKYFSLAIIFLFLSFWSGLVFAQSTNTGNVGKFAKERELKLPPKFLRLLEDRRSTGQPRSDDDGLVKKPIPTAPDYGYIVYTSNRLGDKSLWRQKMDRYEKIGQPELLFGDSHTGDVKGDIVYPRVSPDGRHILFIQRKAVSNPNTSTIHDVVWLMAHDQTLIASMFGGALSSNDSVPNFQQICPTLDNLEILNYDAIIDPNIVDHALFSISLTCEAHISPSALMITNHKLYGNTGWQRYGDRLHMGKEIQSFVEIDHYGQSSFAHNESKDIIVADYLGTGEPKMYGFAHRGDSPQHWSGAPLAYNLATSGQNTSGPTINHAMMLGYAPQNASRIQVKNISNISLSLDKKYLIGTLNTFSDDGFTPLISISMPRIEDGLDNINQTVNGVPAHEPVISHIRPLGSRAYGRFARMLTDHQLPQPILAFKPTNNTMHFVKKVAATTGVNTVYPSSPYRFYDGDWFFLP